MRTNNFWSHECLCGKPSRFVLEWYGLNQYGENPEVVAEFGCCSKFEHILERAVEEGGILGSQPDQIIYEDYEMDKLREVLDRAYDLKLAGEDISEIIEEGNSEIYRLNKRQGRLFPEVFEDYYQQALF